MTHPEADPLTLMIWQRRSRPSVVPTTLPTDALRTLHFSTDYEWLCHCDYGTTRLRDAARRDTHLKLHFLVMQIHSRKEPARISRSVHIAARYTCSCTKTRIMLKKLWNFGFHLTIFICVLLVTASRTEWFGFYSATIERGKEAWQNRRIITIQHYDYSEYRYIRFYFYLCSPQSFYQYIKERSNGRMSRI